MAIRFCLLLGFLMAFPAWAADATIPTADVKGSKDSPLLKRYDGSLIVSYKYNSYDEIMFPTAKLERVPGKMDKHNNNYYAPLSSKELKGTHTRLTYLIPEGRSPLDIVRNYQQEAEQLGGKTVYECKEDECGGDPLRSSTGINFGGEMSLSMYFLPYEKVTDAYATAGECAQTRDIMNQHFSVEELPASNAVFAVHSYVLKDEDSCKALNGRTIAVVEIVEEKARQQKMVTVDSSEMAKQIQSKGSVALYGIYFDFNKSEVKPESMSTLDQVAKLLQEQPGLKLLVVGQTDNVGSFLSNVTLSQRRADAAVAVLTSKYKIAVQRLTGFGASFAVPVASNKAEEGRAKNRRVELVEQ